MSSSVPTKTSIKTVTLTVLCSCEERSAATEESELKWLRIDAVSGESINRRKEYFRNEMTSRKV